MNCCRLTKHLVNGPQRFSTLLYVGKHRTVNQTLFNNCSSVRSYYNGCRIVESLRTRLRKGLQRHATAIWYACSNQDLYLDVICAQAQYVAVHRVWRGQQIGSLHLKLWGGGEFSGRVSYLVSRTILRALAYMGHVFKSKSNRLLLSCSGAFVYDWKKNRIPDEELIKYLDEIEAALCLKRRTFDINSSTATSLCTCDGGKANHSQFERVYGKYPDITARDFMAVNIDTTYRKMWDAGAVILEILETDKDTKSDLIYWEIAWPRMMNNRDYVYLRRYMVDESKKVVVIVNQNTTHPAVPPFPGKERISEYWSIIVIKPITEMNKPGIEFTMTYFDNPGANVPASVMAWGSATAFPEFHKRLHLATKEYASKKKDIATFAKTEEEKGSSVKKGSKGPGTGPSVSEGTGFFGGGSSYLDLQLEQECRKEQEGEQKERKKEESKPTDAAKKPSGCVIRRKEDRLYNHYRRIV